MPGVLDSVVLRQETSETPSTDNDLFIDTSKVLPDTLDVIDNLFECIWFGARTLPVAPKVKREYPQLITESAVYGKIGPVIPYLKSY